MIEYKREKVNGFDEYQIDTNGIVYSKKGKQLKYSLNHNGYCVVNFIKDGKRYGSTIHSLVAKQFIKNKNINATQVNHKDGIKTNNNIENLEWVTPKDNVKHSIEVLGNNKVGKNNPNHRKINAYNKNGELVYVFDSIADAARFFAKPNENVKQKVNGIWRALKKIRKSYNGLIWEYTK